MSDAADTIGIDDLHDHIDEFTAMTRSGRRFALTEEGEVLAYVEPARHLASADRAGSTFQRMVAAGQVRPAAARGIRAALDELGPPPPPDPDEGSPFEELMRMREEERS